MVWLRRVGIALSLSVLLRSSTDWRGPTHGEGSLLSSVSSRNTLNKVGLNIWEPGVPAKLTQKINHHNCLDSNFAFVIC